MTSTIAKLFTQKILAESVQNKFGTEDPFFEYVPATRLNGTPNGKLKKRKKALPPGISAHDAKVLTKVKRRAYRLDLALFSCCGVRFGWGSAIGIIPAIGDVLDALMALIVMKTCMQIEGGLPASLKLMMILNIGFDFVIGLVPFIGDIADALFRANTRNAALLEAHLREVGRKNLKQTGEPVPTLDPSDPHEFDRSQSEMALPEHVSNPPSRHESMRAQRRDDRHRRDRERDRDDRRRRHEHSDRSRSRSRSPLPSEPEPAHTRGGRWFFGRNKQQSEDLETGRGESRSQRSKSHRESTRRRE